MTIPAINNLCPVAFVEASIFDAFAEIDAEAEAEADETISLVEAGIPVTEEETEAICESKNNQNDVVMISGADEPLCSARTRMRKPTLYLEKVKHSL